MNIRHYLAKHIAITAAVVLATTSSCFGAVLSVPQYDQEQDQWCWNASSQMILTYYSHSYSQTAIADWAVGGRNVPNYLYDSPDSSRKGCDEVLWHFGNISSSGSSTSDNDLSAIPLSTLANEIANSRPVMIGWAWDQGGGHAVVVRGISGNSVYVNDPWPSHGQSIQTYDWMCRPYGYGTWNQTLQLTTSHADGNYTKCLYYYNLYSQYYSYYQSTGNTLALAYANYYYAYAYYYYTMYLYGDTNLAKYYYDAYLADAYYYYYAYYGDYHSAYSAYYFYTAYSYYHAYLYTGDYYYYQLAIYYYYLF